MIDRRFRLDVSYYISFTDITRESHDRLVSEYANREELREDPEVWEHAQRERRLLHALLADDVTLRKYIAYRLADMTGAISVADVAADLDAPECSKFEILKPTISMMRDDDARFFEQAEVEGVFFENIEEFYGAMNIEMAGATLTEVEELIADETGGVAS